MGWCFLQFSRIYETGDWLRKGASGAKRESPSTGSGRSAVQPNGGPARRAGLQGLHGNDGELAGSSGGWVLKSSWVVSVSSVPSCANVLFGWFWAKIALYGIAGERSESLSRLTLKVAGQRVRRGLHPLEIQLLCALGVQLVFLPWAFGTMHLWSQLVSLGLGAVAFVLALLPRRYDHDLTDGPAFVLKSWPRLVRFPLFWLGLGLLAIVAIQAVNPWWVWERNATQWWLRRATEISWLPAGIDAPSDRMNAWRQLAIFAAVWFTICAVWIGVTRRRSLQILLGLLVVNGMALAAVGFVQRMTNESKVLWIQSFPDAVPFASFVYRNHGGAYLSLIAAVALALAVWHYYEGRRKLARSTPTTLWLLAAMLIFFAVLFSFSRGAIVSGGFFSVAAAVAFLQIRASAAVPSTMPRLVTFMVVAVILGTVGWTIRRVDFSEITRRLGTLSQYEKDDGYLSRAAARAAATEMLKDHWVRGVGAGGFRHLFPEYVRKHPAIYAGGTQFWEHAHIDWLEIPIELGAAGVAILFGALGWIVVVWWRERGWRHPVGLMLLLGSGQALVHALIDFPFQNPAILTTWWVIVVIALRWVEIDGGGERKRLKD